MKIKLKVPTSNTPLMNVLLWLLAVLIAYHVVLPDKKQATALPERPIAQNIPADGMEAVEPMPVALVDKGPQQMPAETEQAVDPDDPFHHIIIEASQQYRVDPAIVKAIIMAESSYNPKAVSKRGAMGLMQLMPITAKEMGVKNIFDPEHNIHGGVRYYKKLLTRFNGNVELALAAYNAGPQKVKKYRGIPPYKATRYYIRKVIKFYQHYKKEMASDQA